MKTTETQPLPTDALPDERAAFEARFPVPGGVSWSGSGYVVEDDYINSYRCDRFIGQWAAWQARASRGQAPARAADRIVAGAIFDFVGYLTTRDERITMSSTSEASPAVEAIKTWAARRGLSLDEADVSGWRDQIAPQQDAGALEDAARYRWLAGHCRSTSEHWGGRWSIVVDGPAPKSHDSEDDFDAAIDAAIAQQKARE